MSRLNGVAVSELNFNGLVSRIQFLPRPIIIHFVQLLKSAPPPPSLPPPSLPPNPYASFQPPLPAYSPTQSPTSPSSYVSNPSPRSPPPPLPTSPYNSPPPVPTSAAPSSSAGYNDVDLTEYDTINSPNISSNNYNNDEMSSKIGINGTYVATSMTQAMSPNNLQPFKHHQQSNESQYQSHNEQLSQHNGYDNNKADINNSSNAPDIYGSNSPGNPSNSDLDYLGSNNPDLEKDYSNLFDSINLNSDNKDNNGIDYSNNDSNKVIDTDHKNEAEISV